MKGGNSQSAATIYAPNATFALQGTQDLLRVGSGQERSTTAATPASTTTAASRRDFYVAGHPMVGTFTWKRY